MGYRVSCTRMPWLLHDEDKYGAKQVKKRHDVEGFDEAEERSLLLQDAINSSHALPVSGERVRSSLRHQIAGLPQQRAKLLIIRRDLSHQYRLVKLRPPGNKGSHKRNPNAGSDVAHDANKGLYGIKLEASIARNVAF